MHIIHTCGGEEKLFRFHAGIKSFSHMQKNVMQV